MNEAMTTSPEINSPHQCTMCGNFTSWEERQRQAERLKIFGFNIRELKAIIEFAYKNGYPRL